MTIKELKEEIESLPDNMVIVLQDTHGFRPLEDMFTDRIYIPYSKFYGDVYDTTESHEDNDMTESEWIEFKSKHKKALILFPVD